MRSQHRRARRQMERRPLEDGRLGMARVLRGRGRAGLGRRHEDAEGIRHGGRRNEDGGADARTMRASRARPRKACSSRSQHATRSTTPASAAAVTDVVRTVERLPNVQRVRSPLERGEPRPDREGPHSVLVQFDDRAATRTRPTKRSSRSSPRSPARRRGNPTSTCRVRLREREPRDQQDVQQGLPARRVLVASGHAADPAWSRSARSSQRGCRCCSRSPASSRRSGSTSLASHVVAAGDASRLSRDPADRDGGRRRLLALLPPPRAGGARRGLCRATRCSAPRPPRDRRS